MPWRRMKVEINTLKFGTIEIDKERIITFPEGVIGFGSFKRYILLDVAEDSPFKWLQAVEDEALCFLVVNPLFFKPDYRVPIKKEDIFSIQAENLEGIETVVIVTVPQDIRKMTANLKGPLVINTVSRLGKQVALAEEEYSTRWPIFDGETVKS